MNLQAVGDPLKISTECVGFIDKSCDMFAHGGSKKNKVSMVLRAVWNSFGQIERTFCNIINLYLPLNSRVKNAYMKKV